MRNSENVVHFLKCVFLLLTYSYSNKFEIKLFRALIDPSLIFGQHMLPPLQAATGAVLQKKLLLKKCNIHMKTPVLGSLFIKVAGLKVCNFVKKRLQRR